MLEAAKAHLEGTYHKKNNLNFKTKWDLATNKYEVVAGYLSPAHDKYVTRKLGNEAIPIYHR